MNRYLIYSKEEKCNNYAEGYFWECYNTAATYTKKDLKLLKLLITRSSFSMYKILKMIIFLIIEPAQHSSLMEK